MLDVDSFRYIGIVVPETDLNQVLAGVISDFEMLIQDKQAEKKQKEGGPKVRDTLLLFGVYAALLEIHVLHLVNKYKWES